MNFSVIGSGLTGYVISSELLKLGYEVRLYDIADEPEQDSLDIKQEYLLNRNYKKTLNSIYKKIFNLKDKKDKYYFGSGFSYSSISDKNIYTYSSSAKGGLANVWGGNILPYYYKDIDVEWPIKHKDLIIYYRKVINYLNVVSNDSELNNFYESNFFHQNEQRRNIRDSQTDAILGILDNFKNDLKLNNIYYGETNLAVNKNNNFKNTECQKCGLCFYGCPFDIIFNPKYFIENLKKNSNFSYYPYIKINKYIEKDNKVLLEGYDKKNLKDYRIVTDKIFLSAGVFENLNIINNSESELFKSHSSQLLQDAQQFIFLGKIKNYNIEKSLTENNTMAKINISIDNKGLSSNLINIQVYPLSDILFSKIFFNFRFYNNLLSNILLKLFKNYFICIGYLSGKDSSNIKINRDINGNLFYTPNKNVNTKKIIKNLIDYVNKVFKNKDLSFSKLFLKVMPVAASFHVGSCFPMANNSNNNTSDTLGRINNNKNVHIMDSLILPSIHASTTTFTSLSNALRIVDKIDHDIKVKNS